MAAEREQAPASVIVLLTNVFAGLAHRGWELLNRGDAPQDLAVAIADFAAVVPTLSPEFGATERRQSPVADEDLVFAIGKTDDECHDGIAPTMTDSL